MHIDLSKIKSGFSDRLRAISFHIAIIKFKKKINFFSIYEKKNYQCPFKFSDYCKIKKIKIKRKKKNFYSQKNIIFTSYNSEINLKNCIRANKFAETIDNIELYKQWIRSYREIYPNKYLQKKINHINLPKKYVSIHIRSTDRVVKFKNIFSKIQLKDMIIDFHLNSFPLMVTKLISKYSNCKNVYVSSDQEYLKTQIIQKLISQKFNVFYNNNIYKNTNYRKTKGEDFLVDLFCMSKSNFIISTVGGGVPYTAHLLSGKKNKVINWSNEYNKYFPIRCLVLLIYFLKRTKNILNDFLSFK